MSRRKSTKNKQPILENFAQKFSEKNTGAKYVINPEGENRISDAISQIIAPYRKDALDTKSFESLVTYACIAWNTSILPAEEQTDMLQKILMGLPAQKKTRAEVLGFIKELMARKELLFPNVSKMIVEFKVTNLGKDFHIAIASTPAKPDR